MGLPWFVAVPSVSANNTGLQVLLIAKFNNGGRDG